MQKFPILILHGWNLSAAHLSPLINEFVKSKYQVYAPNLPGFDRKKNQVDNWFLSDYVSWVQNFIKEKNLTQIIFIGHSFGGRIGIKLAVKAPELFKALILTGTPGIKPVPRIKVLFFLFLAKIGRVFFSLPPFFLAKEEMRRRLYKIAGASDFYRTNPIMRKTFKNIVAEDLYPYLSKIKVPTLLLWGEKDKIVPLSVAQKMVRLIKKSKLITIRDGHHGLPWTHAKFFVQEVEKFLATLD